MTRRLLSLSLLAAFLLACGIVSLPTVPVVDWNDTATATATVQVVIQPSILTPTPTLAPRVNMGGREWLEVIEPKEKP